MSDSARQYDLNGWYETSRNPISRVGVFPYSGRQIGAPPEQADRIFQVYRPESELSNPETLASFRLAPWTDDHAMLGNPEADKNLTAPENKGVHGVIGERVEYDPATRTVYANLKVWSKWLAELIDAGKKELSLGFRCMYQFVNGNFEGQPYDAIQTNIRVNHLASVDAGRMGPGVAVLDHLKFTFDAKESVMAKKTTRRAKTAKKLGIALDALPAYFGMDTADAATLAKWNKVMDAEEDDTEEGGNSGMTLEDIAKMMEGVAPALASINAAAMAMAGMNGGAGDDPDADTDPAVGDDMEPMLDALGQPVKDAAGKPMMQKKAAPAAPAPAADKVPPALAAMDAALAGLKIAAGTIRKAVPTDKAPPATLAAMDAQIAATEKTLANLRKPKNNRALAAMDARLAAAEKVIAESTGAGAFKKFVAEIAQRDSLYSKVSALTGAFDHAEMSLADVAKYGMGKLGVKAPAGSEIVAVENYLAGRLASGAPPSRETGYGLDAANATPDASVADYLAGKPATKAA